MKNFRVFGPDETASNRLDAIYNVVDLFKLQPHTENPHGLVDGDFDSLFTTSQPIIFNFHGYPWLIHKLAYRRINHASVHVRGCIDRLEISD